MGDFRAGSRCRARQTVTHSRVRTVSCDPVPRGTAGTPAIPNRSGNRTRDDAALSGTPAPLHRPRSGCHGRAGPAM